MAFLELQIQLTFFLEIIRTKSYITNHNYANILSTVLKNTLTTFPNYNYNLKFNDTATTESVASEDQHKWLINCRSKKKKQFDNTTPIEITNKLSPVKWRQHSGQSTINKKPLRATKNFGGWIKFNISVKQLFAIWKIRFGKGFGFLP